MESFCAPIWWEIDHKTILGNGSMCVIETPQSVFGVTANHVLTIYEGHKVAHPDAFCQLGSAPFDPIANLIARSEAPAAQTPRVGTPARGRGLIASDINTRVILFAWLHTQRPLRAGKQEPGVSHERIRWTD